MNKIFLKIGYNTSIQIIGKALSVLLSLITIGILTRYLGTQGYGNFTLVFTYISFFAVIADFGLGLTVVRELADKRISKINLQATYLWLKIILVGISTLLAFFLLLFFPYSVSLKIAILIGGLAVALDNLSVYGNTIFQAKVRLDLITLVDFVTKFATTILIVLFVYLKFGFYSIVSTVLVGNFVGLVLTAVLLKGELKFNYSFDKSLAKKILIYSLPIGFTSLFSAIYFKLDTILLSVIRNSSEVGIYSLSYKVLENVITVWGFYMAAVYPLLVKYRAEGESRSFSKLFRNSIYIGIFSSVLIVAALSVLSPFIISVFAGKGFNGSVDALRILSFSIPFLFINNIFYYRFLIKRKMKTVVYGLIFALAFNLIANVIFIPKTGFIGASYITVVTEIFLLIFFLSRSYNDNG